MPSLINDNMETVSFGNNFGFSATRIEDLSNASEYTLVTLVVDESSSVHSFKQEIEKCIQEILKACKEHPKSDNLLIRIVSFANSYREIHGFKLIANIKISDYDDCIIPQGMTSLYDCFENAVKAEAKYGHKLHEDGYTVNGLIVCLTDGYDNLSTSIPEDIKRAISNLRSSEALTNFTSILIGVNVKDSNLKQHLEEFKDRAELNQFENLEDADKNSFKQIAGFVSKSISSASQNINNSGSQPVSFSF